MTKELQLALVLNLPIVWIRIGGNEARTELLVKPSDKPHFQYKYLEVADLESRPNIIDDIIHKAFQFSRVNTMCVMDHFNRLKKLAISSAVEIIPINKKNMVYQVRIPRKLKELRYPERPLTHVIQLFGRNPKDSDLSGFNPLVAGFGYHAHPQLGYHFETGLLLGPNVSSMLEKSEQSICIDSMDEYVTSIQRYLSPNRDLGKKKGIIISGAFPDCEPDMQQLLINAVHAIVKLIFDKGGTIIFGSHPTFQHMIFDLAKKQRSADYLNAIHMYISKYFVTEATVRELTNQATVYAIDSVNDSREDSLTAMRQAMISSEIVVGIILLGGKQHTHIKPGIDEEYEIAVSKGLPAYIVGSVGGRSAVLAREKQNTGEHINSLTREQNEKLLTSLNYKTIAEDILTSLGF